MASDRSNQPNVFLVAPFPKKRFKGGIAHFAEVVLEELPGVEAINTLTFEAAAETRGRLSFPTVKAAWVLLCELWSKVEPGSIVHYNTSRRGAYLKDMLLCSLLQTFRQVHVVWHIHFAVFDEVFRWRRLTGWLHWCFLRTVDRVVCLGRGFEREVAERFGVRNTVYLANPSTIGDVGASPEVPPLRFLFMGSIDRRKGIMDLLEAFSALKEANAKLDVCGGPIQAELEEAFNATVSDNTAIRYHGYVSGDKRLELIRKSHVLVLPSYGEGLPLVILEFLRSGRPVIATEVGAIPEVIRDGENGLLFSPGDIEALIAALRGLLEDPLQRERLFSTCDREKKNYSKQRFSSRLSALYCSVISTSSQRKISL